MAEVIIFIRDTGDGNFSQGFGPGPDWAESIEDVVNTAVFSQIRVAVYLFHNTLSSPSGSVYLRLSGTSIDETIFLTPFSSLQRNNPIWFEATFTNGPYDLSRVNDNLGFHVQVLNGTHAGKWVANSFFGSNELWVRSYGIEVTAPNKATNPDPSDTGTGVVLFPTLSWSAG